MPGQRFRAPSPGPAPRARPRTARLRWLPCLGWVPCLGPLGSDDTVLTRTLAPAPCSAGPRTWGTPHPFGNVVAPLRADHDFRLSDWPEPPAPCHASRFAAARFCSLSGPIAVSENRQCAATGFRYHYKASTDARDVLDGGIPAFLSRTDPGVQI